jgi:D-alanyl-D-alanine carboxypeptidase/D-alanyl-D-alanine-endopeptidase (penicillin-binding protein 4)
MGRVRATLLVLLIVCLCPSAHGADIGALVSSHAGAVDGGVGVYIKSLTTGRILYSFNPAKPLSPASNMKVVTSAAALEELGPDFRYTTVVKGPHMTISHAILEGNVYLVGSGDPTFHDLFVDDPVHPLRALAMQLRESGVRIIAGDVVGNDSIFDREFLGLGWKEDYLMNAYAAPCGALSLNGNLMELLIAGGGIFPYPTGGESQLTRNSHKTGRFYVTRTDRKLAWGGALPEKFHCAFPVMNPSLFTTKAFYNVLRVAGVHVRGRVRLVTCEELPSVREKSEIMALWSSPPLEEIVAMMNKKSHNFIAEQVFRTVGAHACNVGSRSRSAKAVADFVGKTGAGTEGLVVADGSGLSAKNRISARQLAAVLEYMYRSPHRAAFMESLARPGRMGTLSHRLRGYDIYAKTGSIRGVSSLSGYLRTRRGEMIVFAVITFNEKGRLGNAKTVENAIVETLSGSLVEN